MTADEESLLRADIRQNGLKVPVVMFQNMVLDGRHRCRAWRDTHGSDDDIPTTEFDGDTLAAVAFVRSHNITRRHLRLSQIVFFESQAATFSTAHRGGDRRSKNQTAKLPIERTQAQAAKDAGVGVRSIANAAKAVRQGVPEVGRMLRDGKLTVNRALAISELPKAKQHAALAEPARRPPQQIQKFGLGAVDIAFNRGVEAAAQWLVKNGGKRFADRVRQLMKR